MPNTKNFENMHCDECGGSIFRQLIKVDGKIKQRYACLCEYFEPTQGIHKPIEHDVPDSWFDVDEEDYEQTELKGSDYNG